MPFIGDLEPYFKIHTLLAAALIAGFVGATTQPIILYIMKLPQKIPNNINDIVNIVKFMLVSFVISALYGFIMKWSGLFPHLQKYYYDKLGVVRSMYHDGISRTYSSNNSFIVSLRKKFGFKNKIIYYMDFNSSLETQLSGIKSLLVILNNNIEKTNDDLDKLKDDFKTMQEKIDLIDLKLTNTNQKIDEDLLKECKKMGSHIDFVENVYDNVKHPWDTYVKKLNI